VSETAVCAATHKGRQIGRGNRAGVELPLLSRCRGRRPVLGGLAVTENGVARPNRDLRLAKNCSGASGRFFPKRERAGAGRTKKCRNDDGLDQPTPAPGGSPYIYQFNGSKGGTLSFFVLSACRLGAAGIGATFRHEKPQKLLLGGKGVVRRRPVQGNKKQQFKNKTELKFRPSGSSKTAAEHSRSPSRWPFIILGWRTFLIPR